MTQEDRRLLIKDLCGRSYYKVKVSTIYDDKEYEGTLCAIYPEDNRIIIDDLNKPCHYPNQTCGGFIIDEHKVKPYLFPMSSMTEEQSMEFALLQVNTHKDGFLYVCDCSNMIRWLNENHFDYCDLISKGLAIDATGLNIY